MEKNKKNEGLQSRREFFKKAAKGALPILGAIVLAGSPIIANAVEAVPMGCTKSGCSGTCSGGCSSSCMSRCDSGCKSACSGECKYQCKGVSHYK